MLTEALVTARWKQTALQCNCGHSACNKHGKEQTTERNVQIICKVMFLVAVFHVATWRASLPLLEGGCHAFFWSQMSCLLLDKVFIN